MTQRSSSHFGGAPRAAVRRPFSAALVGIAMALVMCAFPLLSAHAETVAVPGEGYVTSPSAPPSIAPAPAPVPTEATPTQPKLADPTKPPVVAPAPAAPAPAPSTITQATAAPEPSVAPSEALTDSSSASPSASPTASSASPSASSNWDTPIQDGLKATQAASVSGTKGPGSDMFGVIAIMGGVLLVAAGGIAFALWSRNRFSH